MKKYFKNYWFLFLVASIVILIDQWTKYLVRTNLDYMELWVPWTWLEPYARIVHWTNTGAAFGIFQNMSWVFSILAILVAGAIIYYFPQVPEEDWLIRTALGLQMGGALGNLIDRLMRGGEVTDFISVGTFPVLNIADASISVGVALLVLGIWLKDMQQKRQAKPGETPPPPAKEDLPAPALHEEVKGE